MKLILFILLPLASALKGALVIEKLYNTSIASPSSETQHIGLNIYGYAHNQTSKFTNIITATTENMHAISLYFSPAKIISINSTIDHVVSEQRDTLILYSAAGTNETFLASVHIATQSNEWVQNLHSISRLELLNAQNVSEDVNWRDTANIIVRSNMYPSFDKCFLQLQSYRDVNTLSLHFDTSTDLYNSMTIPSTTLSVVNATNNLLFYTTDAEDNAIINPGMFTINATSYMHTTSALIESDPIAHSLIPCGVLENITSVTDCIDDTTAASNESKLCSQHVNDNQVQELCDGEFNNNVFNATIACCVCQGGYILHSTAAQNTTGILSDTTLIRIDGRNDMNTTFDDALMYMTKIVMTFNQSESNFTTATTSLFSSTAIEVASGIFFLNDTTSLGFEENLRLITTYDNNIKYKFTLKTDKKELAILYFHYARRILPFSPQLTIDSIDMFSVPSYTSNVSHSTIQSAVTTSSNDFASCDVMNVTIPISV